MGDSTSLPLHLGLAGEGVKQPMEIEASGLTDTLANQRGKKRPPSPSPLSGDDDDDSSTREDDDGDWLSSGSEEDEDHENNGTYPPFTVDDIPRPCDFEQLWEMVYLNPEARRRGPPPIRLSPPFIYCKRDFDMYNLGDNSEISGTNVQDCTYECCSCVPMNLFQFIDVKIAGYRHKGSGCAKIFGFVAAQGKVDPVRKFVYEREIGNCESVSVKQKTGVARLSLTSPTRVITIGNQAYIEFKLHAMSKDEKGDDDLIIEGCTEIHSKESESFVEERRLYSVKCALDIKFAVLLNAVEARVSIEVLRAPPHGVDLKLCAKTSGFSDVIRLFQCAALEVGFTRSFAVGVVVDKSLELYIKGSPREDHAPGQKLLHSSWRNSFSTYFHGTEESLAQLGDFAEISVKVTWKSYERS